MHACMHAAHAAGSVALLEAPAERLQLHLFERQDESGLMVTCNKIILV